MTAGFECFNAAGVKTLSITDRVMRLIDIIPVSGSDSSLTKAIFAEEGVVGVFFPNSASASYSSKPKVSLSGSTLSWAYPSITYRASGFIFVGVF